VGVGAATGLVYVHLSGPSTQTALTAVTGCTQLDHGGDQRGARVRRLIRETR